MDTYNSNLSGSVAGKFCGEKNQFPSFNISFNKVEKSYILTQNVPELCD